MICLTYACPRSIDVVLTDMEVRGWNAVSLTGAIAEASPRTGC